MPKNEPVSQLQSDFEHYILRIPFNWFVHGVVVNKLIEELNKQNTKLKQTQMVSRQKAVIKNEK